MAAPKEKFRLQSVLDYRSNLVDAARLELSGLQMRCTAEEQRLSELRANERDVIADLYEKQRVVVNVPEVMRLNEHLTVLGQRISNQWSAVQRLRSEMERARGTLLDLTKEMKALEKLKERQAEQDGWETMRAERVETGEVAARRHQMAVVR
jgi:flagellar export protein FliJ